MAVAKHVDELAHLLRVGDGAIERLTEVLARRYGLIYTAGASAGEAAEEAAGQECATEPAPAAMAAAMPAAACVAEDAEQMDQMDAAAPAMS